MANLNDSDLYLNFCGQFGQDQADAVYTAATSHRDLDGSGERSTFQPDYPDHFATIFAFAIGYECVNRNEFKDYHGITADTEQMRQWCLDNNVLNRAEDADFLCLLAGGYDDCHLGDAMHVNPEAEYPFH